MMVVLRVAMPRVSAHSCAARRPASLDIAGQGSASLCRAPHVYTMRLDSPLLFATQRLYPNYPRGVSQDNAPRLAVTPHFAPLRDPTQRLPNFRKAARLFAIWSVAMSRKASLGDAKQRNDFWRTTCLK